ncbi:hypothetical protein N0B44_27015 [Roseibacterium beibuensis]|uniref:Uncharacterized protein n=1 Tax=[Roseibacterium] beibuensis TaxID=1193142 RepID=A0ABP9LG95_9RHOB|nr:hypothetical protein [Roseibacterium beibuensis]MCS6626578.1 hypothetical protein [Roseibacterium beibuensis]
MTKEGVGGAEGVPLQENNKQPPSADGNKPGPAKGTEGSAEKGAPSK